jgi:hypothetical protein
MRGMRLMVALAAALLLLSSGIAWAEQDGASPAASGLSSPPTEEPGPEIQSERTQDSQTFRLPNGELETRIYESGVGETLLLAGNSQDLVGVGADLLGEAGVC